MNPWIGIILALLALFLGGALLGVYGVIFAVTGIVFWLLLQMSRLMRLMRVAGAAPMGSVTNAVMLSSKLHAGMKLVDLITLTGSLGVKQAPEHFVWRDAGGEPGAQSGAGPWGRERNIAMTMFKVTRKEIEWGGRKLVLETGKIARQADGAVLATYGETTVLCTAVGALCWHVDLLIPSQHCGAIVDV
mgnify:CR=1 FL=1